ncbi:MAG TPA: glucoamylase family protein, partial [Nitrospiraceae bacterium]|nr:glucoamylase family protein [Nitrospiraceae bacterium]
VLATAAVIYLTRSEPIAFVVAMPVLALWFASPAIAWWISRPLTRRTAKLTTHQTLFLRTLARKTWAFFEQFVGPDDHWLPPDNYQEHPVERVAHRTSPTNMGLALLANLSAYDFGYISAGHLIERTTNALHTMKALERHRGHFYNWYDTQSLKPLTPTYVSTVDSGNLAGHLLTLQPGLLALPDQKILRLQFFDGLRDTLSALEDAIGETPSAQLAQFQTYLESDYESRPGTLAAARLCLDRLTTSAEEVLASLKAAPEGPATWWARALTRQCRDALNDLMLLAPWVLLPDSQNKLREFDHLDGILTLRELARLDVTCLPAIEQRLAAEATPEESSWVGDLQDLMVKASQRARERIAAVEGLARQASRLAEMEYDFLFDKGCHLLAIGFNVGERRRDSSYYDLLASEARLCCFVAIAQGQLPQESWFALGRLLTTAGGGPVLISWSGSMFEYLMPLLVMPTYDHTLLDQTCKAAVERQIEYGRQRGVPWGVSESGYNTIDVHLNYQYRAFGVPGLGLKRGLADDVVIAPYASALALMVAPEEACSNLQRLAASGLEGPFGLYEAIDYTPSRLPRGQSSAVVQSYMAHHQGMSLLSMAYLLLDRPMQKRFESDPLFQATTLLLQERIPKATAFYSHSAELSDIQTTAAEWE